MHHALRRPHHQYTGNCSDSRTSAFVRRCSFLWPSASSHTVVASSSAHRPPERTIAEASIFNRSSVMDRRGFLTLATKVGGAAAVGVIAGPALLTTMTPLFAREVESWVRVGPMETFALDRVTQAIVEVPREDRAESLRRHGVFVLRTADEITVFSRTCTDLGCPVTWDAGSGWFFCPCHGGIFAKDGTAKAGPPKRPLYRYATRVENGVLLIDLNSLPPMA